LVSGSNGSLTNTLSIEAQSQLITAILVVTRLGAMVTMIPPIDGAGTPKRFKALLVMAMAFVFVPAVPALDGATPRTIIDLAVLTARELLLGMLIGLVIRMLIGGIQIAGETITTLGGMQLGDQMDPMAHEATPVFSRFIGLICGVLFVTSGAHRWSIEALLVSFQKMPPGRFVWHDGFLDLLLHDLSTGFVAGLQAAAPIAIALLLANVITGLLSRTLPQLNIIAVGFSVNALVMLAVLCVSIGSIGLVFQQQLDDAWGRLGAFLEGAR
jgi:flagellar biosynthesis protein FliR